MSKVKFIAFAKKNWAAMLVLCVSGIAVIWFVGSFLLALIYFNDPRHQDEALKGWMTPRYVARSYDLPRDVMEEVFFIERGKAPPRMQLGEIADKNGLSLQDLQVRLDAANAAFEAEREAKHDE